MTEYEAIETIEAAKAEVEWNYPLDYAIAFDMAKEALETMSELKKRNITVQDLENYMKFEDECIKKNFTFKSLIEAREKQTPKKPTIHRNQYGHYYTCPTCDSINIIGIFCNDCCQKIDWSEE